MSQAIIKPATKRHARYLKGREPKLIENDKTCLVIRGGNASQQIVNVLKELYMMKKPNAIMFSRRNPFRPFEDISNIEFIMNKNDASLFLFGSHSKKRPQNLVMGRTFNFARLDMFEFGVENFKSMTEFKTSSCIGGSKPCLMFSGSAFDTDFHLMRLKNLFIDFFRGPVVDNINLKELDYVIQFTTMDQSRETDKVIVFMRSYRINLMKSGSKTPRIELEEMGPHMDLVMRRRELADDTPYKLACRKPKAVEAKKVKNVSTDMFGKYGRIHMTKQNLDNMQTRKMTALKRPVPEHFNLEDDEPKKANVEE